MRRYLAVLLLAGCAMTPNEMRQQDPAVSFETAKSPQEAALCLVRNAENWDGPLIERFSARLRPAGTPTAYEVVVNMVPGGAIVAIAESEAAGKGSAVRIWKLPHLIHAELPEVMASGC